MNAAQLSQIAHEASKLGNLWLEHPSVIAQAHRAAMEAHRAEGNHAEAIEHENAANYWATAKRGDK